MENYPQSNMDRMEYIPQEVQKEKKKKNLQITEIGS